MPITPFHGYTVILLRPDYATSNYGQDTYFAHVDASNAAAALAEARKLVQMVDDTLDQNPQDYFCIALIEGTHPDMNPEL